MINPIELLHQRFIIRDDTYAVQWFNQQSQEWRFVRATVRKNGERFSIPLRTTDLEKHLAGERTIGVYPLRNEQVKWLCLDVDVNKGFGMEGDVGTQIRDYTQRLAHAVANHQLPFLVEDSGNRGFHLWFFFQTPVQATKVIGLGHYLARLVLPPRESHVEVYPKQSLSEYGNFVKLPLGVHQKTQRPCLFIDGSFTPLPDQWQALHDVRAVSAQGLDAFLDYHDVPIVKALTQRRTQTDTALPCMTTMLESGVHRGARDEAAFTLACYLRSMGIPTDLATTLLQEWNQRNGEPLDDGTLAVKVNSAYRGGYSPFPCQRRVLDPYCSEQCRFYESKMQSRGGR